MLLEVIPKSSFPKSTCSIRTEKDIPSFESSYLAPLLDQVYTRCLFQSKALWTVLAQQTGMMYGYSHSSSSVAMAFCLLMR